MPGRYPCGTTLGCGSRLEASPELLSTSAEVVRTRRFVVEDGQYQVPRAVQAANKLIHRDKIFAMVGALGTPMNNAVMSSQFEAGVPNIFPISGARSMAEPLHPLKFAGISTYYEQMRAAIRYLIEERGKERYGQEPNTGSLFGWLFADFTVSALRDAGPDLTVDSLVAAIESIDDYQDIFGGPVLSFGPEKRFGTDESFLAQVQDGRWVRVTENLSY